MKYKDMIPDIHIILHVYTYGHKYCMKLAPTQQDRTYEKKQYQRTSAWLRLLARRGFALFHGTKMGWQFLVLQECLKGKGVKKMKLLTDEERTGCL